MKKLTLFMVLIVLFQSSSALGAIITYELQYLDGSTYRYTYSVTNDGSLGAGNPIEVFDILFDPALFDESSLTIATPDPPASDWDEIILSSGIGIPAAYDVYTLAGGIADGVTISGFTVAFQWLGSGPPGSQAFEIYDPDTFDLLEVGTTSEVPLPAAWCFLLSGLGFIHLIKRRSWGMK